VRKPSTADITVPVIFLSPVLVTLTLWIYYPLVEAFWLSLHDWNMMPTAAKRFVGLENYQRLLELLEMSPATMNTVLYTVGLLPLTVALPLAIALMKQRLAGF